MKKLFLSLLIVLLVACQTDTNKPQIDDTKESLYLEKIRDFKGYPITSTKEDNAEFDAFLDRLFLDLLSQSYLNMHYTVEDYKAFKIEKPACNLGEISFEVFEEDFDKHEAYLNELLRFDYDDLSAKQQYDYQILEYSIYETLAMLELAEYTFYFGPLDGVQESLITNFTEFSFYDIESIEDYLVLLQDIDRYLEDAIAFTKNQAESGIALQDFSLDQTIAFIDDFVSKKEDHALILTFDGKIDAFELSDQKRLAYKSKNKEILFNEVLPAYQMLKEELVLLKGKATQKEDRAGLVHLSEEYAELNFYLKTSDNTDVDTVFANLLKTIVSSFESISLYANQYTEEEYEAALDEYYATYSALTNQALLKEEPKALIEKMLELSQQDFPPIGKTDVTISLLDPATISPSTVAYYLRPPIDNFKENIIRLNPAYTKEDYYTTYTTLAHEGVPGHLYQRNYVQQLDLHPFHEMLSFIAYTEGFAMYAELEALNWLTFEYELTRTLLAFDIVLGYTIEALVDIAVNNYGWSKTELDQEFEKMGLKDFVSEEAYEFAVNAKGLLLPYGVGLNNFMMLKEEYADMEAIVLNEKLLECSEVPFMILREHVKR